MVARDAKFLRKEWSFLVAASSGVNSSTEPLGNLDSGNSDS